MKSKGKRQAEQKRPFRKSEKSFLDGFTRDKMLGRTMRRFWGLGVPSNKGASAGHRRMSDED